MTDQPRPEDFPRIRRALRFYQVTAYITGVLLLLLTIEMVFKYALLVEIEAFGPFGPLALVPEVTTGLNLSRWILIVHGWFYVVYLVACYLIWQLMRWPLWYLLALAAGGVVPFMSFVTEVIMARKVRRELEGFEAKAAETANEDDELRAVEASLTPEERAELDASVAAQVAARRRDVEPPR
ncbi:DUF3817 domain-containing protein [Pseudoclavibacter chungangensis]|uniref:DUF3817 domain-containing protein n=1 Tax=Pseudoclavibacter chungangensis TaxID=587635 RepID=A0A7J5C152_9MICO|nr:DUF3817 domain-containing protein [Pseudoclavibacter chungangensis]KAB1662345.1 DUF3817 domain-containing protein [Pseudoclavibacter chungangensis]NYJ65556.1 integral membrane protein [Pseudoclavibacter chungangensis]